MDKQLVVILVCLIQLANTRCNLDDCHNVSYVKSSIFTIECCDSLCEIMGRFWREPTPCFCWPVCKVMQMYERKERNYCNYSNLYRPPTLMKLCSLTSTTMSSTNANITMNGTNANVTMNKSKSIQVMAMNAGFSVYSTIRLIIVMPSLVYFYL